MKQTNNWEELRKTISDKFYDAMDINANVSALKARKICEEIAIQELTNLLKTVAEAMPKKRNLEEGYNGSFTTRLERYYGFNESIDQIISNISEKYPEFKELVKGK